MIISFCGHAEIENTAYIEQSIMNILNQKYRDIPITFYIGGYGTFDAIGLKCANSFKYINQSCQIIFITPYIDKSYINKLNKDKYDDIIYPELEHIPKKFAIVYRNRWIINKSDLVIAYVKYDWGKSYKTLSYAKSKHKKYINIANIDL